MRYPIYIGLFLLSQFGLKAQLRFQYIDQEIRAIPTATASSTTSLAKYITANFNTETEKIRAIYTWVTQNIDYDKDSVLHFNSEKQPQRRVDDAIRRRKGVCENFAAIFNDLALRCNITSVVVPGYTKQDGRINKIGHTWCAAGIEGKWYLFDPTWDEDFQKETYYFMADPKDFILSHMPFDPLWQLLENPLSHNEFLDGVRRTSKKPVFNYIDSVSAYLRLDTLLQYQAKARRMYASGISNDLADHHYRFIQFQISIIYEERDMHLYNSAVADLNKANELFNEFVRYRNNGFMPSIPDTQISALLLPVQSLATIALQKITQIGSGYPDDQYQPAAISDRLNALQYRISQQTQFVKKYLATPVADRSLLFYE